MLDIYNVIKRFERIAIFMKGTPILMSVFDKSKVYLRQVLGTGLHVFTDAVVSINSILLMLCIVFFSENGAVRHLG